MPHLLAAGEDDKARQLLSDFNWLQNKLRYTSIQAVLEDYQRFPQLEPGSELIYKALLLSKEILRAEKSNLAIQIHQRLGIHLTRLPPDFLTALEKDLQDSICKPISTSYFRIGSLINSLLQDSIIYAILPWKDFFVIGTHDGSIKLIDKRSGKINFTIVNQEGVRGSTGS